MFDCFRPQRVIARLVELNCDELAAQGIRGVLLDLDNTLTAWRCTTISPEVERWIGSLRQAGLTACIVSNAATARRVRPIAERLGLPWVTRAIKPLRRGFLRGMRLMGTTAETTAMVGDQLFTDIYGANRLHLLSILVDPISPRDSFFTKLFQRPLERILGRCPKY
jgi:HAD superfamily phosphatase (TIGR01668 family)